MNEQGVVCPRVEELMARRILGWLAIACLSAGTVWAADDPFVGKWKLDPAKSRLSDQMKVAAAGANRYVFDFGSGLTETIVADGTDQPGQFGTTLAVTVQAPDAWKVVRKKDGKLMTAPSSRTHTGPTGPMERSRASIMSTRVKVEAPALWAPG
jgi:hypothetical protein